MGRRRTIDSCQSAWHKHARLICPLVEPYEPSSSFAMPVLFIGKPKESTTEEHTTSPSSITTVCYISFTGAWMASVCLGTALGYSSPASTSLSSQIVDVDEEHSIVLHHDEMFWFSSVFPIGGILGCIVGGPTSQYMGRRPTLYLCSGGFTLSWLGMFFSETDVQINFGRLATGFFAGVVSMVSPVYISELSPAENRGFYGGVVQLGIVIGIFYSFCLGRYLSWSRIALFSIVPPILMVPVVYLSVESPRWLLLNEKKQEALSTLELLRRGGSGMVEEEWMEIEKTFPSRETPKSNIIMGLHLLFLQQFSGINSIIFYASSTFLSLGIQLSPHDCSIIVALLQVIATAATIDLLDLLGRRFMIITSSFLCLLMLILMGLTDVWFEQVTTDEETRFVHIMRPMLIALYIVGFSIGLGPAVWIAVVELVTCRGYGILMGSVVGFHWACAYTVTMLQEDQRDEVQKGSSTWLFCATSVVALALLVPFLPETNGLTLEAILLKEVPDTPTPAEYEDLRLHGTRQGKLFGAIGPEKAMDESEQEYRLGDKPFRFIDFGQDKQDAIKPEITSDDIARVKFNKVVEDKVDKASRTKPDRKSYDMRQDNQEDKKHDIKQKGKPQSPGKSGGNMTPDHKRRALVANGHSPWEEEEEPFDLVACSCVDLSPRQIEEDMNLNNIPAASVVPEEIKPTLRHLSSGYLHVMFAPWVAVLCLGNVMAYGVSAERSMRGFDPPPFDFGDSQSEWFTFFLDAGAIAGCILGGTIGQLVGPVHTLHLCALAFSAGWLCVILTRTIFLLYLGRILKGFSCGMVAVCAPVYVTETVRAEFRGFFAGTLHVVFSLGALLSVIGGHFLSWRLLASVSCVPVVVIFLASKYAIETPHWLYHVGRTSDALEAMYHLRAQHTDAREEFARMEAWYISGRTSARAVTCAVLVFCIRETCGYGYIVMKSPKFLEALTASDSAPNVSIVVSIVQLILALTATFLMDLAGHRPLLMLSALTVIISDFALGIINFFEVSGKGSNLLARLSMAFVGTFVIGYSLGLGPIPGILAAELVPPRNHGLLTGLVYSTTWIAHSIVKVFFQRGLMSEAVDLCVIATITALELFLAMSLLPDTSRLRLEQIAALFEGEAKTPALPLLSGVSPAVAIPAPVARRRSLKTFFLRKLSAPAPPEAAE
ncbi:uncharacterized protein LOC135369734 [Ornithodoros turicata]|uniref:uncharacterized protein LOC135369734 n=1 Tax=Ornithodoros turicata TaxID=34597 RepID=UPI003139EAB8